MGNATNKAAAEKAVRELESKIAQAKEGSRERKMLGAKLTHALLYLEQIGR